MLLVGPTWMCDYHGVSVRESCHCGLDFGQKNHPNWIITIITSAHMHTCAHARAY